MIIKKFEKKIFAYSSIVKNSYFIQSFFCLAVFAFSICTFAANECSKTSKAALRACNNEVQDDYNIAIRNCLNLPSFEEQEACSDDALKTFRESMEECWDQFDAREEICEALGQEPYHSDVNPNDFPFTNGIIPNPNSFFVQVPGTTFANGRITVPIADARLKIEANATDFDAGIQVFIDADPWMVMEIFDPTGKKIFRSTVKGRFAKQGGTELFMESAEPEFSDLPFEEFLERFPEGEYRFRGVGLEREIFDGSATLTHDVPDGPVLVSPLEGGPLQDPNDTVVEWEPVLPPNGSPIIAYQVLVEQTDTPFPALPKITLDVMMPANAASLVVPPGFLLPDTEYEWEVLAIEESGNQTLSSSFFTTMP